MMAGHAAAHVAARAAFAACCLAWLAWLLWAGPQLLYTTHGQHGDSPLAVHATVLPPPAAALAQHMPPAVRERLLAHLSPCAPALLDISCQQRRVVIAVLAFSWLVPALAVLSGVLVLATRGAARPACCGGRRARLGRRVQLALGRLIWPRRFWLGWTDGLTLRDLLVVLGWLAINIAWLVPVAQRYALRLERLRELAGATLPGAPASRVAMLAEQAARVFGALLAPNLLLLLLPISRGNALFRALGVHYTRGIRYHRWLGFVVVALMSAHGLLFFVVWASRGEWLARALERGPRINNLMGGISLVFGLVLWLTSLEAVRRHVFDVFKTVHILASAGFLVAALMHSWGLVWFLLPPLMVYALDGVFRLHQAWARPTRALAATASPGRGMCALTLATPRGLVAPPTGLVWLCVRKISRHAWHPFTYVAVPTPQTPGRNKSADAVAGAATPGPGLLLHIRPYAPQHFTQRLIDLVAEEGSVDACIQGPLPDETDVPAAAPSGSQECDGIILLAGGLGVSPIISALVALGRELGAATQRLPVLLVWSCASPEQLQFMGPRIMAAAHALGLGGLTVRLFCTAHEPELAQLPTAGSDDLPLPVQPGRAKWGLDAAKPSAQHVAGPGASGSDLCPAVALSSRGAQVAHNLLMAVAVFSGAFAAIAFTHALAIKPSSPWPTVQLGGLLAASLLVGTLLPGTLVLWLGLMQQRHEAAAVDDAPPAGPGEQAAGAVAAVAAAGCMGQVLALPAAGGVLAARASCALVLRLPALPGVLPAGCVLPIELGRPDMRALLGAWLASVRQLPASGEAPSGGAFRVLAAGPPSMVNAAELLCDDLNRARQAGLVFSRLTHTL